MLMNAGLSQTKSFLTTQKSQASTTSGGTTITADATIHTKGATPTQLISSTSLDSYGILVELDNTAVSNTATSLLLDIMTGSGGSEVVLIPNLMAGYIQSELAVANTAVYYFPIFIPSGTRISARCQALITVDTVVARVTLYQRPSVLGWVGSRVTAYGINTGTSRGVDCTVSSSNAYGTAGTISGSTTNPIRYMQLGAQHAGNAALTDTRVWFDIRLGASNSIIAGLPGATDTGLESVGYSTVNTILSNHLIDLPAGVDLRCSTMMSSTSDPTLDVAIYGVD